LADNEMAAILAHERAHLRARHDLVLEMFIAVHAAFPRFVRSAHALNAVQLLIELLADDAAGGPTTVLRVRRLGGRPNSRVLAATAYFAAAAVVVVPTVALAVPWLTELHRLFIA
jgi:Zn-dependent protease with chaperone function